MFSSSAKVVGRGLVLGPVVGACITVVLQFEKDGVIFARCVGPKAEVAPARESAIALISSLQLDDLGIPNAGSSSVGNECLDCWKAGSFSLRGRSLLRSQLHEDLHRSS